MADWVGDLEERIRRDFSVHGLPQPRLIIEPGRSLVGEAGVTLYRVGAVKEPAEGPTWVAIDGGLSDNPRPLFYGARYEALIANPAREPTHRSYAVCGHHCESGDILIRRGALA